MNLVLIGYRATGKTSVGRLLSEKLGRPLIDTDDMIQDNAGRTIPEIVEHSGWDHFRKLEKEAVKEAGALDRRIIATGGGVVLDPENTAALRASGYVIWLKASVEAIQTRLAKDDFRPPLEGKDSSKEVAGILVARRAAYEGAAHVSLDTTDTPPALVMEKILVALPPGTLDK